MNRGFELKGMEDVGLMVVLHDSVEKGSKEVTTSKGKVFRVAVEIFMILFVKFKQNMPLFIFIDCLILYIISNYRKTSHRGYSFVVGRSLWGC